MKFAAFGGVATCLFFGAGAISNAAPFDDELNDSATLSSWQNRQIVEGSPSQYTILDINESTSGNLTLIPTGSAWFATMTGPFLYQLVSGNFVISSRVTSRSRTDPDQAPLSAYNSAGILVRDPASAGLPNSQNWLQLNIGNQESFAGIELESTVMSSPSVVIRTPTNGAHSAVLRVCRVGNRFSTYYSLDDERTWIPVQTVIRNDLPVTLQVGLATNAYSSPADVRAELDFVRFAAPNIAADCTAPMQGTTVLDSSALNDSFEDASTLQSWTVSFPSHMTLDINASTLGRLTIIPSAFTLNAWYADYQATHFHKTISGDFVAETDVNIARRDNPALTPRGPFNAGGFLIRDPASTSPGQQRYIVYNVGYQNSSLARELKTTQASLSTLYLTNTPPGVATARLRVCRIDDTFRFFYRHPGANSWSEERIDGTTERMGNGAGDPTPGINSNAIGTPLQFIRSDLPPTIQIGAMANAWASPYDTRADFDYFRFALPRSAADCTSPLIFETPAAPAPLPPAAAPTDPAIIFSDNFDDATSLTRYTETAASERTVLSINAGLLQLTPAPHQFWYGFDDGPALRLNNIAPGGDFVFAISLNPHLIGNTGARPNAPYNVGGMMIESTTSPFNWIFASAGRGGAAGVYVETKTNTDGYTFITDSYTPAWQGELRICRVGSTFRIYRRMSYDPGLVLLNTFERADLAGSNVRLALAANGYTAAADVQADFDWVRAATINGEAQCTVALAP